MPFDMAGNGEQVCGRVDHHADRNLDAIDVGERGREGERRKRIAAQVDEPRLRGHVGRGYAEGGLHRFGDGRLHRLIGTPVTQDSKLPELVVGHLGVELFQPVAIARFEFGPQELSDSGQ